MTTAQLNVVFQRLHLTTEVPFHFLSPQARFQSEIIVLQVKSCAQYDPREAKRLRITKSPSALGLNFKTFCFHSRLGPNRCSSVAP